MPKNVNFQRLFNSYGIMLSNQILDNSLSNMGPYRYLASLPESVSKTVEFGAYYTEINAVQLFGVMPDAIKNLIDGKKQGTHIFNDNWYYTVEHFIQDIRHLHHMLDPQRRIPPRVFMQALSYHADLNAQINMKGGGFRFKRPFSDCVKLALLHGEDNANIPITSPLFLLWLSDLPSEMVLQYVMDGKNLPLLMDLARG